MKVIGVCLAFDVEYGFPSFAKVNEVRPNYAGILDIPLINPSRLNQLPHLLPCQLAYEGRATFFLARTIPARLLSAWRRLWGSHGDVCKGIAGAR